MEYKDCRDIESESVDENLDIICITDFIYEFMELLLFVIFKIYRKYVKNREIR